MYQWAGAVRSPVCYIQLLTPSFYYFIQLLHLNLHKNKYCIDSSKCLIYNGVPFRDSNTELEFRKQYSMYYVEVSGFGWINTEVYVAEREGFEPSEALPLHVMSNHAPSTTRSPLLNKIALHN